MMIPQRKVWDRDSSSGDRSQPATLLPTELSFSGPVQKNKEERGYKGKQTLTSAYSCQHASFSLTLTTKCYSLVFSFSFTRIPADITSVHFLINHRPLHPTSKLSSKGFRVLSSQALQSNQQQSLWEGRAKLGPTYPSLPEAPADHLVQFPLSFHSSYMDGHLILAKIISSFHSE